MTGASSDKLSDDDRDAILTAISQLTDRMEKTLPIRWIGAFEKTANALIRSTPF